MSSTDAAILSVAVLVPLMVAAREVVRIRRHQALDYAELLVIIAAGTWGLLVISIYRTTGSPRLLLPAGMAVMGLYLLLSARPHGNRVVRMAGALSLAVGIAGFLVLIVSA